MEIAAQTGAVAAGALDRPGAAAGCVLLGDAKQLAVAVRVRGRRRSGDDGAGGRRHDRHDVLVAVGIDTEHVVQFVCKHPADPPTSARRVRWCRSDAGKPRRQDGNESRR
jgi:hypothetical protein